MCGRGCEIVWLLKNVCNKSVFCHIVKTFVLLLAIVIFISFPVYFTVDSAGYLFYLKYLEGKNIVWALEYDPRVTVPYDVVYYIGMIWADCERNYLSVKFCKWKCSVLWTKREKFF